MFGLSIKYFPLTRTEPMKTVPNFYSRLSYRARSSSSELGQMLLLWLTITVNKSCIQLYADSCLSFIISIKQCFQIKFHTSALQGTEMAAFFHKCIQKCCFDSRSVMSRASVGVKQIMHPAAEDKSLLRLLRSFVCSQGPNKEETHHTLKNECEKHLTWQLSERKLCLKKASPGVFAL